MKSRTTQRVIAAIAIFVMLLSIPIWSASQRRKQALNRGLIAEIMQGNADAVGNLIAAGADVNQHNTSGETPLFLAHKRKLTFIEDLLKTHGAKL